MKYCFDNHDQNSPSRRKRQENIDNSLNNGYKIIGVDFSKTDLTNEKLAQIVDLLLEKLGTIQVLNIEETHTDAGLPKNTQKVSLLCFAFLRKI